MINKNQTSAANTTNVITIAAVSGLRISLFRLDVYSSAGTASVTIQDGSTTIYTLPTSFVTTTPTAITWTKPLETVPGNSMTITLGAAGVGNTTTLNVEADQFV